MTVQIDIDRLMGRIFALGKVGALQDGGVCRLALTDEDKQGRDLLVDWMTALALDIHIDGVGNIIGIRKGRKDNAPVMIGSHIDSVATGGLYDGALGVLSGLEIVAALNDHGVETQRPIVVVAFTNEEGVRFAPDMLGSLVYADGLSLEEALGITGIDGTTVGDDLARIGYAGDWPVGGIQPHAYLELHIEQGPVLETEAAEIGVVEGVQGISWTEITFDGTSAHAGTTPMRLRHDAGRAAAEFSVEITRLAEQMGESQVCTIGAVELHPNLVNVVPERAVITLDLRNPDEERLKAVEAGAAELLDRIAERREVGVKTRKLARFEPVAFAPAIVDSIEAHAAKLGYSSRRMYAGAGHDAQMIARMCPAGMIFIPSKNGLSHNVTEYSAPEEIARGAGLLLEAVLDLAGVAKATGDTQEATRQ
ncbi:M20 family metallo-hydrolase [Bauldia sp.]|uniref:M20 family metallo-hydrolase n=1 Tax=Bauldia sp. TaxID=2575872 RepID=UPI003BACC7EE